METDHRAASLKYWEDSHRAQSYDRSSIRTDDWLERFEDIIKQTDKPVLDLGCGGGNDTLYLLSKGKQVIPCDMSETAIANIKKNFPEVGETYCFNMLDGFPFEDGTFDLIIADLCLHYFTEKETADILQEIKRILLPGGHLIFRVNSVNDKNHGAGDGTEIEHHVYETKAGTLKRFFDEEDIRRIFGDFEIEFLNEEIMSRYKLEKRLFRVCVRKQ
ncbi:MAG: class I SAM-dependent methyltransferase [Lachnospiraceae bacterium]|nr:class I SAM-dependent methyltransferase [Lachnospiraceae bacterium]